MYIEGKQVAKLTQTRSEVANARSCLVDVLYVEVLIDVLKSTFKLY